MSLLQWLCLLHGAYFALTGIWPLAHLPSFEAVTGEKTDKWLVRTVGVIVLVIGSVLMLAAVRDSVTPEIFLLAAGSALGLGLIDAIYVSIGRIPRIYLADAVLEAVLLASWVAAWLGSGP